MPIFTGTPVQIAPSPFLWIPDVGSFNGPFHYGGAIYFTGFQQGAPFYTAVAKSTNGGATWTNFVQSGAAHWVPESGRVVLDPTAGQLVFLISNTNLSGAPFTFYFDLVGELFSSVTDSAINATEDLALARRPNGDIVGFVSLVSADPRAIHGVPISGNAFGVPFLVDPGIGAEHLEMRAAISDASGVIHIAYRNSLGDLLYNPVDATNTPGTRQTIDSGGGNYQLSNALAWAAQNQIIFTETFRSLARVYVGTPISGPTWTAVDVHASTPGITDGEITAVDAGSTVKLLYQHHDATRSVLEIMEVDWNGSTMGAPAVYWDIIANPPAGASGLNTDGITADLSGGILGVAVTCVINHSNDYSAVYVSTSGAAYRNKVY